MKSPVHDANLAPHGSVYRASIVLLMRKKITAVLIIVSVKLNAG